MGGMKYALAMVAAGGTIGAASQAAAATVNLNIGAADAVTGISLAGAAGSQFSYGFYPGNPTSTPPTQAKSSFVTGGTTDKVDTTPYYTPGVPASDAGINGFAYDTVKAGALQQSPTDFYLHLKFTDDLGKQYLGSAHFDGAATLESITYSAANAVPEPETWALLIAGMGLAGAALRRRNAQAVQPPIA